MAHEPPGTGGTRTENTPGRSPPQWTRDRSRVNQNSTLKETDMTRTRNSRTKLQVAEQECDYEYRHPSLHGQIGARDMHDAASSALAAARDDVAGGDLQVRCAQPGACGHSRHWAFVSDIRPDLA